MKSAQGLILEGKFEPARPKLNESLAIVAPLARTAPGNSRIQRTWISALSRLAYLERQVNCLREARAYLADAAGVAERALKVLPDDSDLRQNATFIYSQLGLTDNDLEDFQQARIAFSRGLELSGADLARDPRNSQIRSTWAMLANNHAQLLWNLNERDEALALLRRAVEVRRELAGAPGSAQFARLEAASIRMSLALRLMESGGLDEALREGRLSIQDFAQLTERADFRVGLQHGMSLFDLSLILDKAGQADEARAAREQARRLLEPLAGSQPKVAAVMRRIEEKRP
jgi:tetratricopeptide (TPR) repeat protein